MKQPVFGLRASLVRTPASSPCVAYSRTISCVDCRSPFLAATAQHRAFLSPRTETVRPLGNKEDDDSRRRFGWRWR